MAEIIPQGDLKRLGVSVSQEALQRLYELNAANPPTSPTEDIVEQTHIEPVGERQRYALQPELPEDLVPLFASSL